MFCSVFKFLEPKLVSKKESLLSFEDRVCGNSWVKVVKKSSREIVRA